jgi:hypothetical protein
MDDEVTYQHRTVYSVLGLFEDFGGITDIFMMFLGLLQAIFLSSFPKVELVKHLFLTSTKPKGISKSTHDAAVKQLKTA